MKIQDDITFEDYVRLVSEYEVGLTLLYRGQDTSKPLLPKIARRHPQTNTTETEQEMLREFRRRGTFHIGSDVDDWEALIHAQHWGMATRLLDWTSNPLAALWFACRGQKYESDAFVYILEVSNDDFLDRESGTNPFKLKQTRVFRPLLNNERIIAQSGWFTIHRYSESSKRFVALDDNKELKSGLHQLRIPIRERAETLRKLDTLHVNEASMLPDLGGLCAHLNWKWNTDTALSLVQALRE